MTNKQKAFEEKLDAQIMLVKMEPESMS